MNESGRHSLTRSSRRPGRSPAWWRWMFWGLLFSTGCQAPGTGQNVEGVQHYQQGNVPGAIQKFQQALLANPQNPDAYYNLASCYYHLGKQQGDDGMLRQAESLYHQCLDLHPDHVACHRALAVLLVDTERPESAFTLLERWAVRSPHLADARIELARLHEEFGQPDSARRYLTEAIDIDATNARAWTALGHLREDQGQLAQALSNYQQAYHLNNFQPGVAHRIAQLQQRIYRGVDSTYGPGTRMVEGNTGWTRR